MLSGAVARPPAATASRIPRREVLASAAPAAAATTPATPPGEPPRSAARAGQHRPPRPPDVRYPSRSSQVWTVNGEQRLRRLGHLHLTQERLDPGGLAGKPTPSSLPLLRISAPARISPLGPLEPACPAWGRQCRAGRSTQPATRAQTCSIPEGRVLGLAPPRT